LSYSPAFEELDLPWRTFGLDVNLISPSNRWSLSTGVQYADLNNASSHFTAYNNSVDMSLTYRQQLSDRLNITLIGHHFEQSGTDLDDMQIDPQTDEQLAFMLNFTY
jgi:hypothetical protein